MSSLRDATVETLALMAVGAAEEVDRQVARNEELIAQRQACQENAGAQVAAATAQRLKAEAKVTDIGWRKNRLIEAIEARGFVVRWQQDGTPEVLTKEEAAERDKPKPISSNPSPFNIFSRFLKEERDRAFDSIYRTTFYPLASETIVASPPTEPKPQTAKDYYDLITERVFGVPPIDPHWYAVSQRIIDELDAALRYELDKRFVGIGRVCYHDRGCPGSGCRIWHGRPWRRG